MTKSELNQRWAELEGWTEISEYNGVLHALSPTTLSPNVDELKQELPDFTEPNRFFAKVVPRMKSKPLYYWFRFSDTGDFWNARLISHKTNHLAITADGKTIGEAGLEAAIKARMEVER